MEGGEGPHTSQHACRRVSVDRSWKEGMRIFCFCVHTHTHTHIYSYTQRCDCRGAPSWCCAHAPSLFLCESGGALLWRQGTRRGSFFLRRIQENSTWKLITFVSLSLSCSTQKNSAHVCRAQKTHLRKQLIKTAPPKRHGAPNTCLPTPSSPVLSLSLSLYNRLYAEKPLPPLPALTLPSATSSSASRSMMPPLPAATTVSLGLPPSASRRARM